MSDSTTKTCCHCRETKPLDQFGKHPWCKSCLSAARKERYATRPEYRAQALESARRRREQIDTSSPEYLAKMREYQRRYSKTERGLRANRERRRRNYHESPANRAYQRNYYKQRYHTDPEYAARQRIYQNENTRRWREQHPGRAYELLRQRMEADSEYAKRYRERMRHHGRIRATRKTAAGGSYTQVEWERLCAFYDHRCVCCNQQKPLTVDHVIPVSLGGTSDIINLQPLCKSCNSAKNDRIIDYRTSLPDWIG